MELETLKALLDISNRQELFEEILQQLKNLDEIDHISIEIHKISDGPIPIIYIGRTLDVSNLKTVKIFVGAQHNEYNGLFSILEFLTMFKEKQLKVEDILKDGEVLLFAPLMNPYGFLNPSRENKSGYYLRNGTNLNRFWRRAFAPEYINGEDDLDELEVPEQVTLFKRLLKKYWKKEYIKIFLLDFHETSLLEKFPRELSMNLTLYYKFDHWLKEGIILNVMKLYKIPFYRKPLFYKCSNSADHNHIQLSLKQLDTVFEKLLHYISKNHGKLPFYFAYSNRSEEYCKELASNVYDKFKDKVWETYFPAFDHSFHDHGCFVKLSDATSRKNFYSMELENQKHFFDIFKEIEKSKNDPDYFSKKLDFINVSLELAIEAIKEMINLC
jgi:hypothetical protein